MSGLSRKYMGLEPVTKREIDVIINRLSKPKKRPVEDDPVKVIRETRPTITGTGRFVGRKRMSRSQIEKMVARLCNKKPTLQEESTDQDADLLYSAEDEDYEPVTDETHEEKPIEKPTYDRKNSILRRDSSAVLRTNMNVSFQEIDIPKLNLDTPGKLSSSNLKDVSTSLPGQTVIQRVKDAKQTDVSKSPKAVLLENFKAAPKNNITNKRQDIQRGSANSDIKTARFETVRPSTSDPQRSPKLARETQRPSTSDSPQRSPRLTRQNLARFDEANKQKSENRMPRAPTPCDDLLIDRVATYNRSPRARQDIKR